MLNKVISVLLICLICLTAISPIQLNAQTQENQIAKNDTVKSDKKAEPLDLKQFFSKSATADSPIQLDTKKLEKEKLNSARRSNLSKGQKTALYIGIAAAIAAVVTIVLVTRKNSNDNCYVTCTAIGCPPAPPCD